MSVCQGAFLLSCWRNKYAFFQNEAGSSHFSMCWGPGKGVTSEGACATAQRDSASKTCCFCLSES